MSQYQPPQGPWGQQPQYPPDYPPQYPQQPPMQPQKPAKKPVPRAAKIGCTAAVVLVVVIIGIIIAVGGSGSASPNTSDQSSGAATQPTAAPTQAPTVSPALLESTYKATTTDTTVANLDKDGAADQGNDVHFSSTILNFVKDSSGNTAGANVDDPNNAGSVLQVLFPAGTDLTQLNQGDTLEVWGTDGGVSSGQNAFGATIQEVVITGLYMTDHTTNYQSGP